SILLRAYETQPPFVERFHNIPHYSLDFHPALNRLDQVGVQFHQDGPDCGACGDCVHGVSLLHCAKLSPIIGAYESTCKLETVGVVVSESTQARMRWAGWARRTDALRRQMHSRPPTKASAPSALELSNFRRLFLGGRGCPSGTDRSHAGNLDSSGAMFVEGTGR